MKTITHFKSLGLLALLLILFAAPATTKAQPPLNCPYKIVNNTQCDAIVSYTLYSKLCVVCPCNVCTTVTGAVIPFGTSIPVPCGGCSIFCQIDISVDVLGVATPGVFVSFPAGPTAAPVTGSPCVANIVAGSAQAIIQ